MLLRFQVVLVVGRLFEGMGFETRWAMRNLLVLQARDNSPQRRHGPTVMTCVGPMHPFSPEHAPTTMTSVGHEHP